MAANQPIVVTLTLTKSKKKLWASELLSLLVLLSSKLDGEVLPMQCVVNYFNYNSDIADQPD